MPLSRFDALSQDDRAAVIEYFRELDLMRAYEEQLAEDKYRVETLRNKK